MQRGDSLEKTLMLEKIEGKRRKRQQRIRWLGDISDSIEMSLRKLREIVSDRQAWHLQFVRCQSWTQLSDWVTMRIPHFAYLLILWWAHGSISCFSNVIMVLWTWSTNHSSKSYFQFFWVYPNIELLDHEVTQFLIFWVISKLFPQHIVLPPTVQKDYNFFISLTTLVAFVFWLLF